MENNKSNMERAQQLYSEGKTLYDADREKGLVLLVEAADLGHGGAAHIVQSTYIMQEPYKSDPKYIEKGKKYLKFALSVDDPGAMACYGIYLYNGAFGFARDEKKAITLIKTAAGRGDNIARNMLAVCYRDGRNVPQDFSMMFHYLRLAAAEVD